MQELLFFAAAGIAVLFIVSAVFDRHGRKKHPPSADPARSVPSETPVSPENAEATKEPDEKVLVGSLSSPEQLSVCLSHRFYHIPARIAGEDYQSIKYIAIYQSRRFFGAAAGVRYYAKVSSSRILPRREISEIPRSSDLPYVRFETDRWQTLPCPILPKGKGITSARTTFKKLMSSENMIQLIQK